MFSKQKKEDSSLYFIFTVIFEKIDPQNCIYAFFCIGDVGKNTRCAGVLLYRKYRIERTKTKFSKKGDFLFTSRQSVV